MVHDFSAPPRLGRRRLLQGATGLGALATLGPLGACAAPASLAGGDGRIRFWNLFSGGDGANMRAMLDRFRSEYPELTVEDTTLAWGDRYYTKLAMAGAGGRAPEVGVLHLGRLAGFAPGRLLDPIDPVLLAAEGVHREDFNPRLWDRAMVDGELYGLPLDVHASLCFYNRPACAAAGLLDGQGRLVELTGVDTFLAALDEVRGVIGQSPLGWNALMSGECWWTFLGLYQQTGGTMLSEDGTGITLDDDRAEEVLALMARLVADEYAIPGQDLVGYFVNGGGFVLFGNWLVVDFDNAGVDYGATPYPTLFGTPATQAESHCLVLPHQRGRGGGANEAAHRLIAWLVRNSVSWAEASHVPAYLPVLEDPEYLAMEPQAEYRSAMDMAAFDPPAWFFGTSSRGQNEVGVHLSAAALGSVSPAEGVRGVRSALRKLINTRNPFGEGSPA
ncbi:extracellular solute-binding protein [Streptomyces profundus]|uniref:extracellular solute-binding protein n=1 Tax=Streptomyces profundus TaxID=2867410 RepID=UPI001D1641CD|nr:extracellular solute-binding protein [Streptomyces sp. MA3_2.13]UED86642.1 extracellular solute-binding protein [Streptomyces sp. MA3_2.13]